MYCFPGESFFWTKLNLKKVSKPFISYGMPEIGPLQDPVKWYGINYAGTQISKQRKVGLDWYEFLCFESPTRYLRPSVIYSVPCDLILQRAYFGAKTLFTYCIHISNPFEYKSKRASQLVGGDLFS